jgi:iron(III) transport system ATP-binding protein
VRAQEADRTIVDCGLGTLACKHRECAVGTEVTLCIRPEFIHVEGGGATGDNVVNGRIESEVFVGETYESEIRVGNELVLARIDPNANLKPGDPVSFRLEPAHCMLVLL